MFRLNPWLLCLLVILFAWPTGLTAQNRNSTKKKRIEPSDFSSQCGSAVNWRSDVDKAMEESATSGKPVFWYVPTIAGSFMDRKPVIDQYMMAGPFSWPAIIELLNNHFIPVKSVADGALQRKFKDVKRYKFVEPGFVVLNSDGSVKATVDQITTLDPNWISTLIAGWAGVETPSLWSDSMVANVDRFRRGELQPAEFEQGLHQQNVVEQYLLVGMFQFRAGQHEKARETWRALKEFGDHPLAWKALAEAEGWGPFVRGFENHQLLPDKAYRAGIDSRGSAAPKELYSEEELWNRSTQFLMATQDVGGGWTDSDYDFGGFDSLPNVYIAVTALCGSALLDSASRLPQQKWAIMDAVVRAADYCNDRQNINFDDRDEILWAHAFRVRFFARLVSHSDDFKRKYGPALQAAVKDLESIQTERGTWYHEYANSFVTATALTALKRAEQAGAEIDKEKIKRGALSLANDRFDNGAYPYYGQREQRVRGSEKSTGQGQIPASSGRMPLCELGLWQWGASDDSRLQAALNASFANHKYLAVAYKYDNHTDTMAYGGFFFWYDMRSRAEALTFMTDADGQKKFAAEHRQLVLDLPELDGCFVDSHELGRCYGTAMALLTLAMLDEIENR